MPRIAVDARMIRSSGIGVVLHNLLSHIIPMRPFWEFQLFGNAAELGRYSYPNVQIIPFSEPIYSLKEQRLGAVLNLMKPNLAWTPHYNIPLLWRGRLFVTVHDLLHLAHKELFPGVMKQAYARFMLRRVMCDATCVAFVSQFTAGEFNRLIGAPRLSAEVIHNGVDVDFFSRNRPSPHLRPYILLVGNIKPHKNVRRFINAFRQISARLPHDIVLVGRKEGFITGERNLEAITSDSRILFTGVVDDERLAAYYAHAAVLAMPSIYEGFGLPPLEAMASGCPVLAARASSLPEICGNAAEYCDPLSVSDMADTLYALLTDEGLRNQLRQRGRDRVTQFGWKKAAAAYVAAMERLL